MSARFIYPEFQNGSVTPLLWEFEGLESDPDAAALIRPARNAIDVLRAAALLRKQLADPQSASGLIRLLVANLV